MKSSYNKIRTKWSEIVALNFVEESIDKLFRPEPAVDESYAELPRDWTYNLPTPPRTLLSYCCDIQQ